MKEIWAEGGESIGKRKMVLEQRYFVKWIEAVDVGRVNLVKLRSLGLKLWDLEGDIRVLCMGEKLCP